MIWPKPSATPGPEASHHHRFGLEQDAKALEDCTQALAKGTEMLLIRAEAALRANDLTNAMLFINQGRTAATLAPLTATTVAGAYVHLMRERGAVLWLEGRRLFDLKRWLAEGRNTTLQGRSTCIPISLEERGANPNVTGAQ